MFNSQPQNGVPGLGTERSTSHRQVTLAGEKWLPGVHVIDGSKSRDPLNTPVTELRAGLLLGRITASKKLAPAVLGVLTVAFDTDASDPTSMTVSAATATEINRRIGSSGTFKLTGPPTAGGTVATQTVTFSAVNTTTGVITVTDPGADAISGSFIQPTDGSEAPVTVMPNGFPVKVVDADQNNRDVQLDSYLLGALVDSSQILNWPSDTALRAWIVSQLNAVGEFVFDHLHGA